MTFCLIPSKTIEKKALEVSVYERFTTGKSQVLENKFK